MTSFVVPAVIEDTSKNPRPLPSINPGDAMRVQTPGGWKPAELMLPIIILLTPTSSKQVIRPDCTEETGE